MKKYKLGFLGAGKMGSSILNGVISSKIYKKEEILIYEYAGTYELIDIEIDLKRVQLSDDLQIEYDDEVYGYDCVLYLAEEDIDFRGMDLQ